MFPALVVLLLILLVAVVASLLTWSTVRDVREEKAELERRGQLNRREGTLAAVALYHQAERMEAEARALEEAGFSTARQALDSAAEMRTLARRLDPNTAED
ncbi:MAG: hypothetical protein QJR09_13225 [Micrococcus sp.]|nr:hypothetical protein [Micrococcus sp.]